ncbi:SpoIIE family protein phosphatase [Streptomyces sp. SID8358]|uniref:SpoIIE family protein phosphatase n=1 Tax=Streptomyces sp. SID8358 TaxID=2690342 RepID=UPI000DB85100
MVTEELLPAFGGRQLAICLQRERRLHLARETESMEKPAEACPGIPMDTGVGARAFPASTPGSSPAAATCCSTPAAGGVELGVDPKASYPPTELCLAPGDVLAPFTDGLVEQAGEYIDEGTERLRTTLAGVGGTPLAEAVGRVVAQVGQDENRPDDIALLPAARPAVPG